MPIDARVFASLHGDFAAAVDDLEVGSASAASIDGKEVSPFRCAAKTTLGSDQTGFGYDLKTVLASLYQSFGVTSMVFLRHFC